MALHLGQVEVRPRAPVEQRPRVVEEVEREVEDARRHRVAVDEDVLLAQVPAARPHEQGREVLAERVLLAVRARERDRPRRTASRRLICPWILFSQVGVLRVLEVGHEHVRARVEGVDDHLAVDRAGDLDAAVLEVGRGRGDLPARVGADVGRLGEEVGKLAGVEPGRPLHALGQQLLPAWLERAMELRHERQGVGGEDLRHLRRDLGRDLDSLGQRDRAHGLRDTFPRRVNPRRLPDGSIRPSRAPGRRGSRRRRR